MFPLKDRKLIRGYQAHIQAGLGGAADYEAEYVPLYAPFDGTLSIPYGEAGQGGKWLALTRANGDSIQFAHLSQRVATGNVKAGDHIAITGNTGTLTAGPHLHVQIINKGRLDPETYNWEDMRIVDRALLFQIYNEILFRDPDPGSIGYIDRPEDEVRKIVGDSLERQKLVNFINQAKAL